MNGALSGKRIVNTRAAHQAQPLDDLLRGQGAVPISYPCIAITPPTDPAPLDDALSELAAGQFDWLLFTSTNTVAAVRKRLNALEMPLPAEGFRTAAVGPATARAAQELLGLQQVYLPAAYIAEALADELPVQKGERVLLPESAVARPTLVEMLTARGALVCAVDAYQTTCGEGGEDVPQLLAQQQIDALTFTSSSTVICFVERLAREGGRREDALGICAACIGPKTAAAARENGFARLAVPSQHTLDGLVQALDTCFSRTMNMREQI